MSPDARKSIIEHLHRLLTTQQTRYYNENWSDKDWTREVKQAVCDLGREQGYGVAASGVKAAAPEWLLDVTWYSGVHLPEGAPAEKQLFHLTELVLAFETENSPHFGDIKDDFEKLLVVNAPLRVLLSFAPVDLGALFSYCSDAVARCANFPTGQEVHVFAWAYHEDKDDKPPFIAWKRFRKA